MVNLTDLPLAGEGIHMLREQTEPCDCQMYEEARPAPVSDDDWRYALMGYVPAGFSQEPERACSDSPFLAVYYRNARAAYPHATEEERLRWVCMVMHAYMAKLQSEMAWLLSMQPVTFFVSPMEKPSAL